MSEAVLEKLSPAQRSLRRDFFLSFKFSQGESGFQGELLRSLVAYYQEQPMLTCEELNQIDCYPESLVLPRFHYRRNSGSTSPANVLGQENIHWALLLKAYGKAQRGNKCYGRSYPARKRGLLTSMIHRDTVYQASARPTLPIDPHRSFFREYVLLDKETGSRAFDWLHDSLRDHVTAAEEPLINYTRIHHLVSRWELAHPDQQFWPEAFKEYAGPTLTAAAVQ